jgi:predicted amidophosphoribosyltransferase
MESCSCCGIPLPNPKVGMCSACREGGYHFTSHRSYASYAGNMKRVIWEFKYRKNYGLKDALTGYMSQVYHRYFYGKEIDLIDTVPGEHMDLLAGSLSRDIKIAFAANIMRIREPERQGNLGFWERKTNILDCYKLRDCLAWKGKNILLVDDVWTTGSTLNEMSCLARRGGAKNIYLLTLARRT